MNDRPIQDDQDDLAGFETYEGDIHDDAPLDDTIADADFQDVQDDIDPEVFGEEEPAPAPKKKTNWFNIGVAACAILVAGGLVLSKLGPQLMGGAEEQPSMAAPSDMTGEQLANTNAGDSQASIAQALGQNSAPATAQSGGVLDNPEGYAELAQMPAPDAPALVKVEAAPDPFAGLPAPAAATPVTDTSAVPMPAPIAAEPMPAPVAATTTVTTSVTTPAPAQAETAAPAVVTGVETQSLMPVPQMPATAAPVVAAAPAAEVTEKMTAMEARLDALDAKLEQMQPAMAAPANDERLNAIQATLSRLEGRLDDLSAKKSAPVRSASVSNDYIEDRPVKKAVVKKAKPKKATPPADAQWDGAYTPSASRPAPALNGGGWQLRGAKPGSAIIAKGNDIREVMVGDSVPGLGQIGAVSNNSGRWTVQGTQGTLSQ